MYDIAKKARAGMKSKAERLAGEKDHKTDSSDWSPAEPLNADVKTGMRPVSRQARKRGGKVNAKKAIGKVMGEMTKQRADRVQRKAGGKVEAKGEQPLVDRYINRDLKKANEYRDGEKHEGALKRGGRAKLSRGGEPETGPNPLAFGTNMKPYYTAKQVSNILNVKPADVDSRPSKGIPLPPRRENVPLPPERPKNLKKGGKADKACSGGRMGRKSGGRAKFEQGGGAEERAFRNLLADPNTKVTDAFGNPTGSAETKSATGTYTKPYNRPAPTPAPAPATQSGGRGRGRPSAPVEKSSYTPPRVMGGGQGVTNRATPSVTTGKATDKLYYEDANPVNYGASLGNKRGGRIKKADGGGMMDPRLGIVKPKAFEFSQNVVTPGLKRGGKVKKAAGGSAKSVGSAAVKSLAPQNVSLSAPNTSIPQVGSGLLSGSGPTSSPSPTYDPSKYFKAPSSGGGKGMGDGAGKYMDKAANKPPFKGSGNEGYRSGPNGDPTGDSGVGGTDPNQGMYAHGGRAHKKGGKVKGKRIAKQIGGALGRAVSSAVGGMGQNLYGGGTPVSQPAQNPMGGVDYRQGMNPAARTTPIRTPAPGGVVAAPTPVTMPTSGGATLTPTSNSGNLASLAPAGSVATTNIPTSGLTAFPTQTGGQSINLDSLGQPYTGPTATLQSNPTAYARGGRTAKAFGGSFSDVSKPKSKSSHHGKGLVIKAKNVIVKSGRDDDKKPMNLQAPMGGAPMQPPMPPMGMGAPQPAPQGGPMGAPPAPQMPPMGPQMPGGFKRGGRITKVAKSYKDMEAGSGSGEGRLQKTDIAKRIPKPAFEKGLNLSDARGYPNKVPGATGGRTARKTGGKVYRSYKDMDAGSGSGMGRLEKTEIQSRKK